jgi:arginase
MKKKTTLIGIGSGWGAPDQRTARGPEVVINHIIQKYPYLDYTLDDFHENDDLPKIAIKPFVDFNIRREQVIRAIETTALRVQTVIENKDFPIVIGGDHSLAMGTWVGAKRALKDEDFSLLWFDAHMDAHTIHTSPSLALHGMPVSALLGYDNLIDPGKPILKAEHLYQFGVRSFEDGEAELLKKLNVHIDYVHECKKKGLGFYVDRVLKNLKTQKYGVSIDIDAFDPSLVPGTGTTEPDGLDPNDLLSFLSHIADDENCLALEIVEFNPDKDVNNQTLNWIIHFIEAAMTSKPIYIKERA